MSEGSDRRQPIAKRVGVDDAFAAAVADVTGILERARIVNDVENDMYRVYVSDRLVLEVPAKDVRRQSFSLNEYLARELRGILCVACGEALITGETGICSRCEARQVRALLDLRAVRRQRAS